MLEIKPTILFEIELGTHGHYFLWVRKEGSTKWMVKSWADLPSENEVMNAVTLIKKCIDICTKILSDIKIVPSYINPERPLIFPD